jgi:hypothetical protein
MKKLILRNLNNIFYKQDRNRKYSVHYDPINNNIILFSPHDDCTIDSVCNSIRESIYSYLINILNTQKNIIVSWSQVSGTSSDYTIYYDIPIDSLKNKTYKEILSYLCDLNIQPNFQGYKYTEVKDNIKNVINFQP